MYRYRYEYIKDNADYDTLLKEHRAIVDGLKRRDEVFVREVMHTHLKNQMDGVSDVIRRQEKAG